MDANFNYDNYKANDILGQSISNSSYVKIFASTTQTNTKLFQILKMINRIDINSKKDQKNMIKTFQNFKVANEFYRKNKESTELNLIKGKDLSFASKVKDNNKYLVDFSSPQKSLRRDLSVSPAKKWKFKKINQKYIKRFTIN